MDIPVHVHKYATTYSLGLLQAKAYRILTRKMKKLLEPYGITPIEWALLGLTAKNSKKGTLLKTVATELGVSAPFISTTIKKLQKYNWIIVKKGKNGRERMVSLTPEGKRFLQKTEKNLRVELQDTIAVLPKKHLVGYIETLHAITMNGTTNTANGKGK